MKFISYLTGTVFGIGFFPYAPGTITSLATLGVLYSFYIFGNGISDLYYNAIILILFFVGILSGSFIEQDCSKKDPKFVVIDEVVGMMITFVGIDLFGLTINKEVFIAGFLLFRFFDIVKPYPVNILENVRGGLGIMADDFVAGFLANCILKIGIFVWNVFYFQ
ncbi:MAG: phosphatidylglycerophosphatase A [Candidatus Muirbacterium halophilum]|nr:phosphatidylglycerophosphatase A [Candidatus Muirbacterium halophilum]MCK9476428.1 phosphatidylglycerophosphatase A [Candidatus Muirbacterium halophilum]